MTLILHKRLPKIEQLKDNSVFFSVNLLRDTGVPINILLHFLLLLLLFIITIFDVVHL